MRYHWHGTTRLLYVSSEGTRVMRNCTYQRARRGKPASGSTPATTVPAEWYDTRGYGGAAPVAAARASKKSLQQTAEFSARPA